MALAMALAAPARADDGAPSGGVDNWHNPAGGTLPLVVHGTAGPGGAHLDKAAVLIDGATVNTGTIVCDASPCDVGKAPVDLDTTKFADGLHHLTITVSDTAGHVGTVFDYPSFEIDNTPPSNSSTATLTIGSDVSIPPPSNNGGNGGKGGVLGGSAASCASPKLSMLLAQKPVRVKKGVAVLYRGKSYRFTGRLTCVVRNKRVSAPKKTKIQLFAIVKGKSASKGKATVGSGGKITIKISAPSSRTLEFRFTNADKKVSRVRIKVQVVKAPKKHKQG